MSEHFVFLYVCMAPGCDKVYNSKFNLKRHVDCKHWGAKTFVCETCGHVFSSKQNLEEHGFLHTGEKPFACPHCPQTFRQASQFSLHKRVHRPAGSLSPSSTAATNGRHEPGPLPSMRDIWPIKADIN